ncbi:MAG: tetratricopeptide repeat protein [Betaproteobacteria bacterium]|nr:tetratricopeptide repeat protein [Betaproteobacteria bacterium]
MTGSVLHNLTKLLDAGRDDALTRFALGNEYLKANDAANAAAHLRAAVRHDPAYSAAWKLLGRALEQGGELADALEAYREGARVAEARGDKQAAKEMTVFARRIEKQLEGRER